MDTKLKKWINWLKIIESEYEVRCKTCYKKFTTQLFESHEKNLWLVDKKDWYCETCKTEPFEKQTSKLAKSHAKIGFPTLIGTPKRVSWAEKIRADLINKVSFLKQSLVFNDDKEKETSDYSPIKNILRGSARINYISTKIDLPKYLYRH